MTLKAVSKPAAQMMTPEISDALGHSPSNGMASMSAPDGTRAGNNAASDAPMRDTVLAKATGAKQPPRTPCTDHPRLAHAGD